MRVSWCLTCCVSLSSAIRLCFCTKFWIDAACPNSRWVVYRGHCYLAERATITWNSARTACKTLNNSHLVTINDKDESNFIANNLLKNFPRMKKGAHFGPWIGLNDIKKEGDFVWIPYDISVKTTNFTNWEWNEPSNQGNEDCVKMWKVFGSVKWNDAICASSRNIDGYICEYNLPTSKSFHQNLAWSFEFTVSRKARALTV